MYSLNVSYKQDTVLGMWVYRKMVGPLPSRNLQINEGKSGQSWVSRGSILTDAPNDPRKPTEEMHALLLGKAVKCEDSALQA